VDSKLWDEINRAISEVLAQNPAKDMEKTMRVLLQSVFARLNLVTREEFDIQQDVLARAREKLAMLETKLSRLEAELQKRSKQ
jgi:BMFP domain-containing protein YqiC